MLDYNKFAFQCEKYGYNFEPFTVRTEDAWHLTVFHITGYRSDKKAQEARD